MTNCQLELFGGDTITPTKADNRSLSPPTTATDTRQLVKRIISKIQFLPGNDRCCECNAPDPEWLSVNLGLLICIHCSGRHRELGVQYSRIRSLKLDALKTSELLIARVMGNSVLNEVMEANLTDPKPSPDSDIETRRHFIVEKYTNRKYIEHQVDPSVLSQELLEAIELRDIKHLLQVYAEGADLKSMLICGRSAIHLAIEQEDLTSLHMVDFILGNSRTENVPDEEEGNTPLHIATLTDNPQCIKLLLNHNANPNIKNKNDQTPLDIAEEKKFDDCIELLQDASKKKYSKCEHIDIDWGVSNGDCENESIYQTPVDLGHGSGNGGMKRSETEDNIVGGGVGNGSMEKNLGLPLLSTGGLSSASPRLASRGHSPRRPLSQLIDVRGKGGGDGGTKQPFVPQQPNLYPPPSEPAPPPPLRTVSRETNPLPLSPTSVPVVPKRKKRQTMMGPAPVEEEGPKLPPSTPPPVPTTTVVVEAIYNCVPDRPDELAFSEGDKIVVVTKLNKDWWVSAIQLNVMVKPSH
ncbi:PREDICTED: arf-GAP with SH3 domain, ANK repeat and PH domain-containing protein 2-like [Amphimedon queenslandica]|uniref:SH3 domain-containing protein n=1 Tax=Amphimedon queenslandica TaxID=400682 RepID=A0AAN0IKA8_AMPQE|nr:PREDICTED: arf-GAP with SH3 domain, ANK repeat and PH domain-containing protein 2-like [Amphimedon queenslandica]|eukprot:XP_011402926.1 PREDICTED: arf-GAP with SH3 domain, ANK repeat and PH domain-containing protein 2-like [Amphimedon queenslandica]